MAQILLEIVINNEINECDFLEWLITSDFHDSKRQNFSIKHNCSQPDFISYFLNFIHEQLSKDKIAAELNKSASLPLDMSAELDSLCISTPKLPKISSDSSLNYTTPISPLYRSFSTPKSVQKSPLVLGDFITTRRVSSTKKKWKETDSRRIKPTNLNETRNSSSNFGNSFNFNQGNDNLSPIVSNEAASPLKVLKPVKLIAKIDEIEPNLKKVTNRREIDQLARIYLQLVRNGLVFDLANEMHFLTSCLVKKQADIGVFPLENAKIRPENVFNSIHNAIYFAGKCLAGLGHILAVYDKATLKLLAENRRLSTFFPDFIAKIDEISAKKANFDATSDFFSQNNVCFDLEADNKSNFPDVASFHAFRKQRDLFYDILRLWQSSRLTNVDFHITFKAKIHALFALSSEPINLQHFSRLFKAQLLNQAGSTGNKQLDPDAQKMSQLTNRCITKSLVGDDFDRNEAFFRDFIDASANHRFYRHLIDALIQDISDSCAEYEDFDQKRKFYCKVKSLVVLAKFLGYIETIAYKSELKCVKTTQIDARKATHPNFDCFTLLKRLFAENSLILCIPWLTSYLSMLDDVTLQLPYYTQIYAFFYNFYKNFESSHEINTILIKFCIGTFLESINYNQNGVASNISASNRVGCDNMALVDENLLYLICPYMENVKKVLQTQQFGNNACAKKQTPIRHIRPVSDLQSSAEIAAKKLEKQLEEAFYNGQPQSVRKTIEFVSERVASACVKHICVELMANFKKIALERWRKLLKYDHLDGDELEIQKSAWKTKASEFAVIQLNEFNSSCKREIFNLVGEKIAKSIDGLTSKDILEQTRLVCVNLASKSCMERINQWLTIHVTASVFLKDFNDEIGKIKPFELARTKKPNFALPSSGTKINYSEKRTSAAHLAQKITDLTVMVVESGEINDEIFDNLLLEVVASFEERGDVSDCIKSTICSQILDLNLILMGCDFDLNDDKHVLLQKIWTNFHTSTDELFKSILSPRNVMIFARNRRAWEKLAKFCVFLLKSKLMSAECFEAQSTAMFRHEWDEVTLGHLTRFFRVFLDHFHGDGSFSFVLGFLADYCADL